jgi:LacI family transcriptional regulator, repressor for deo operon, udp, cdd, tsx, nupC, and nupG
MAGTRTTTRKRPGPAKTESATIYDVAQVAGVSTATVSRAIAKPDMVAWSTRKRVAAAARELGYSLRSNAKTRPASAKMILALIERPGSQFFAPILEAITGVLAESGYCLVIADFKGGVEKDEQYSALLREGHFAGLISFAGRVPEAAGGDDAPLVPVVLVCRRIPTSPKMPIFDVMNREAARRMVSYLISIGHRSIAHICGPKNNVEARERLAGYGDALLASKIAIDEDLIWDGDFYLGSGIAAAGRFLARADRPTAVFAANDQMAIGFINELKGAGISVPQDVSVAGFDDIEYSVICDPPLTTMHQPRSEIGRQAALEILRRIHHADGFSKPSPPSFSCELVIRTSTQPLRLAVSTNVPPVGRQAAPERPNRGARVRRPSAQF